MQKLFIDKVGCIVRYGQWKGFMLHRVGTDPEIASRNGSFFQDVC